jgi:hypothetical protein
MVPELDRSSRRDLEQLDLRAGSNRFRRRLLERYRQQRDSSAIKRYHASYYASGASARGRWRRQNGVREIARESTKNILQNLKIGKSCAPVGYLLAFSCI